MEVKNPGLTLPFYSRKEWQISRQIGQNRIPYGLPAPNTRLVPLQVFSPTGSATSATWTLVDASNEANTLTMDSAQLQIKNRVGGGWWVIWYSNENLSAVPPCGFWYPIIEVNGVEYVGEVLHLKPDPTTDVVGLTMPNGGCSFDGGILSVEVEANDTLSASPQSQTIEFYSNSEWNEVGDTSGLIQFNDYPPNQIQVRRVVVTEGGSTITANYLITWDDAEDPCASISMQATSVFQGGGSAKDRWRIRWQHTTDKETILYQTGFYQQLFVDHVFDGPVIEREETIRENGYGREIARYSRTVERIVFEVKDLPDYALLPCSIIGDHSIVFLENASQGYGFELKEVRFESRRQGSRLHTGRFSAVRSALVFTGCQKNYDLE